MTVTSTDGMNNRDIGGYIMCKNGCEVRQPRVWALREGGGPSVEDQSREKKGEKSQKGVIKKGGEIRIQNWGKQTEKQSKQTIS